MQVPASGPPQGQQLVGRDLLTMGQVQGLEKVSALYGYVPTFHDARILRLQIHVKDRKIVAWMKYTDLKGSSSSEHITTWIKMSLLDVKVCDLNLDNWSLYDFQVDVTDAGVIINLDDPSSWSVSSLNAEKVEFELIDEGETAGWHHRLNICWE